MRAHLGDLEILSKIYLWKFQRDQKSGQYVLLLSARLSRDHTARARALRRTERRTKNEKLIVPRETRFIQNSPMTVSSILQGHILWSQMYGRTYPYGPDKLSVLAARKATSRMPEPEVSRKRNIWKNNSLPCWISSRSCRKIARSLARDI